MLNSALKDVAKFHRQSSNMSRITPPPLYVQMMNSPDILSDGSVMEFIIWFGPIPIKWRSLIEDTSQNGFVDRQLSGPFKSWSHNHRFQTIDNQNTIVIDEIQAELQTHPLWFFIGLSMWLGMPILFAYRGWKTKREIRRHKNNNPTE